MVGKPPGLHSDAPATSASKRAVRTSTFKSATLQLITGERFDVIVRNISSTGARVEFMRDVHLPDRVYLKEPTQRLSIWAYVVWQERGVAGLEFVPR